jgi:polyisoprenoid-binding protein YceI
LNVQPAVPDHRGEKPLKQHLVKHWKAWLVGIVVVAVAAIVGGPYLYIHVFDGNEAAPLQISDTGSAATAVPADGNWQVGTGSQAGYRVHETLVGQSTTAVGRTSKVTGSAVITGTDLASATFTVDMSTVASDKSQRDTQFRGSSVMDTAKYPNGTFTLTKPIALGSIPAPGKKITVQATGTLNLHGVTKSVTFSTTAVRNGSTIQVQGSIPVTFSDFNVTAPDFGGFVVVDHTGDIEFLLNLTRS